MSEQRHNKPKVTVYIPCHNYGRYLSKAIDSVLEQSFQDWEAIIIDDGSLDETAAEAQTYINRYPEKISLISHYPAKGLQTCANLALEAARGDYFMRLDADDYLDESALLVLSRYLDEHHEVALVYPNYFYVDDDGNVLGVENRKKIGKEAQLLDLPAHGACTMIRKRILKTVGGYNEFFTAQDGHELWLQVLHRYKIGNVLTPLFYYRQHAGSISRDEKRILSARQRIKRHLVKRIEGQVKPRIVAVVPAKNTYKNLPNIVLRELAGSPLIDYTLNIALQSQTFDSIFVSTDDPRVVEHCQRFENVIAVTRPPELSLTKVTLSYVLYDAVSRLENEYNIYPDILVLLSVHSPIRKHEHIRKAIDTLLLYNADNVISVYENFDLHFTHQENGLKPLNQGMLQRLRLEREALYTDNGSIKVFWRDMIKEKNLYAKKNGHIVMSMEDSYQIKSEFDFWMMDKMIQRQL